MKEVVADFLRDLELVDPLSLDDSDHNCSICLVDYPPASEDPEVEFPVRLPCGHVFGSHCLVKWYVYLN